MPLVPTRDAIVDGTGCVKKLYATLTLTSDPREFSALCGKTPENAFRCSFNTLRRHINVNNKHREATPDVDLNTEQESECRSESYFSPVMRLKKAGTEPLNELDDKSKDLTREKPNRSPDTKHPPLLHCI